MRGTKLYIYIYVCTCIKIDFISGIMNKTFFLNLYHVFFINLSIITSLYLYISKFLHF